jgi:hypothetical protein
MSLCEGTCRSKILLVANDTIVAGCGCVRHFHAISGGATNIKPAGAHHDAFWSWGKPRVRSAFSPPHAPNLQDGREMLLKTENQHWLVLHLGLLLRFCRERCIRPGLTMMARQSHRLLSIGISVRFFLLYLLPLIEHNYERVHTRFAMLELSFLILRPSLLCLSRTCVVCVCSCGGSSFVEHDWDLQQLRGSCRAQWRHS